MLIPMSTGLIQDAGGGGGVSYVGSVTKSANDENSWDSSGEALDVTGISGLQNGDLLVIAFSFDSSADATWTWNGMSFTSVLDITVGISPGRYAGYRVYNSGTDSNPYVTDVTAGSWDDLSIVCAAFRGVTTLENSANASGSTGTPNPASVTAANATLRVVTGHTDDSDTANTAMADFTLAASESNGTASNASTTAIAYWITDTDTVDPDAFGSGESDAWGASHMAFS